MNFSKYLFSESDKDALLEGIQDVYQSGIFDAGTLKDLRLVTFDSQHYFVFTKGKHLSTEKIRVDLYAEGFGFHVYQIPIQNAQNLDYGGATAWFEESVIEDTAVKAVRVKNPKILEPTQKNCILKTVLIPPKQAFVALHEDAFDYKTDLIFHEIGHVEEMLLRDWPNEGYVTPFPSNDKKEKFFSRIRSTSLIPSEVLNLFFQTFSRASLGEMYATMIDREAKRIFSPEKMRKDDASFLESLKNLGVGELKKKVKPVVKDPHQTGYILSILLEFRIPDFSKRKAWLQNLMQ
ncbi:MAG TPA: hypothetical protein VFM02_04755 [Candidatus Paceibacterota bacterium]|nr:hypothetical protein [Candidatus Paceibacterota bacterium]